MTIETIRDILHWTREYHAHLSTCMQHCATENSSERAQMMLKYLSTHESRLAEVVAEFEKSGKKRALDTWIYEYLERHPIVREEHCDSPFANMNSDDVVDAIFSEHEQIIDLYKFLESRAETRSTHELLKQLSELEHQEALVMAQAVNRFADM